MIRLVGLSGFDLELGKTAFYHRAAYIRETVIPAATAERGLFRVPLTQVF